MQDFDVIVYNTLLDIITRAWMWRCFGASLQLLILLFGLEDCFGAFLNGTRYKGTYALTRSLRSFGHHLVSGSVQVSGDGMGKSLSRPTTFASVALWRHGMILVPALRSRAREDHRSTRKRGRPPTSGVHCVAQTITYLFALPVSMAALWQRVSKRSGRFNS